MNIFYGERGAGKTTLMISMASEFGLYIVCDSHMRAKHIAQQAKEQNLVIPYPITVDELPLTSTINVKQVLIDDLEAVLPRLIGSKILAITTSIEATEIEK